MTWIFIWWRNLWESIIALGRPDPRTFPRGIASGAELDNFLQNSQQTQWRLSTPLRSLMMGLLRRRARTHVSLHLSERSQLEILVQNFLPDSNQMLIIV